MRASPVGQRFGKVVVKAETDQRTSTGKILWLCRCDCGALIYRVIWQLRRVKSANCGCVNPPQLVLGTAIDDIPTGGTLRVLEEVPARPVVVSGGVELEPVWFPHRDARSLLEDPTGRGAENHAQERGSLNRGSLRWSFLG